MPSKAVDRRPFANLEDLQEIFDAITLEVSNAGGGEPVVLSNQMSYTPEPSAYLTSSCVLKLAQDDLPERLRDPEAFVDNVRGALETAGFADDDVVFRVTGMTRRLRLSAPLKETTVAQMGELISGIELARGTERPEVLQAPFGGCDLSVEVLLSSEAAERVPLRPWRRGTWLARTTFRLGTAAGTIGFTPLALTDEHRARLELPLGTVRFVELGIDVLDKPTGSEDIILWVDPDLLSTLAAYPKSVVADNLQRQMLVDAVTSIVFLAARSEAVKEAPESKVRDTLLGRVLEMAGAGGEDLSEPLELLRTKPEVLIATIEARQDGILKGLRKALASEEQGDPT
jgi:hypothetical protein